jgi:hypothetical protein
VRRGTPPKTKDPNPSPIGKKFGFCCCGANGDTELFEKRSNIDGLLVVGKRYLSQLKAISLI